MRHVVIFFCAVAWVTCLGAQTSRWILFKPEGGRFEIKMPAKPKGIENRFRLPTEEEMPGWNYILEDPGTKMAFTAGYNDWPESWLKRQPADWFLDSGREGMIKTLGGKLTRETKIEQNGYPGREIMGEIPGLGLIWGRIFLVGTRYYQISVVYKPANANYDTIGAYLESFSFSKN